MKMILMSHKYHLLKAYRLERDLISYPFLVSPVNSRPRWTDDMVPKCLSYQINEIIQPAVGPVYVFSYLPKSKNQIYK